MICSLCSREVPELTEHHLVPKSRGGKDCISICADCHKQLHSLYDNKHLENILNTPNTIKGDKKFSKYTKWVSKKQHGAAGKTKRAKDTKNRGRRG